MAFRESRAGEIDIHDRLVQECDATRHAGALERFDIASSFSLSPVTLPEDETHCRGNQTK